MDFNLKDSLLGKGSSTPESYDASLLFPIPRSENRERYGIKNTCLPFVGVDVWNCYELSFLTANGLPVSRMMKLIYSSDSEFIVESKSLKLYLNSFNMEKFDRTVPEALQTVRSIIRSDLERTLGTPVEVVFFGDDCLAEVPFADLQDKPLTGLMAEDVLEKMVLTDYLENPRLLKSVPTDVVREYGFRTDLLRSNCRVTNQPDWGDLFVRFSSRQQPDYASIIAYLVSFRKENHFHEEVVEMIYKRFMDAFQPEQLVVAAMYTRRGGIDINPIRASQLDLLENAFISTTARLEKTLRQ